MANTVQHSMQDSLRLFDEVRKYFGKYEGLDVLIEVSEQPMSEWKIISNLNQNERRQHREQLIINKKPFAAYEVNNAEKYYLYSDQFLIQRISLLTGEVIYFQDMDELKKLGTAATKELKLLVQHTLR